MKFKVVESLGLSDRTVNELNSLVDSLPGRPSFKCQNVLIGNEQLEFHFRDVLACIRAIYGDPEFALDLVFAPERHYVDHGRTQRVYSDMYTGDWWWSVQVRKSESILFYY
jgi:hypothetical protein